MKVLPLIEQHFHTNLQKVKGQCEGILSGEYKMDYQKEHRFAANFLIFFENLISV